MTTDTRTVPVRPSAGRGYDVIIGEGVLDQVTRHIDSILGPGRSCVVISDQGVPEIHHRRLTSSPAVVVPWHPSESNKTIAGAASLLAALAQAKVDRSGVVIALGGGITGDVAGFAAATFQRGIAWVNCPTTLLAMVDAGIGGKTGVNLDIPAEGPGGAITLKNMVGAFHQPILVAADTSTLASLPEREFRCGLAECIKHGLMGADWDDPGLLAWMRQNLAQIRQRHPEFLIELIARNVAVKARVVEADALETGEGPGAGRMALNLGHTFAHAIEPIPNLSPDGVPSHAPLQHGEAVALGLIAAAQTAAATQECSSSLAEEVTALVRECGLPTKVQGLPPDDEVIARMAHDKKARAGILRLILPSGHGGVRLSTNPSLDAIKAGLAAIRA